MNLPVMLPTDLLPAGLPAGERPRPVEAAASEPCYRSEAFAEDLPAPTAPVPVAAGRAAGWLFAAPLATALVGALAPFTALRG